MAPSIKYVAALAACLPLVPAVRGQDPDTSRLENLLARQADPERPPATLPAPDPDAPRPALAYTYDGNTFLLSDGTFFLLYFDTPRAVLLRSEARYLASDSRFYYYRDQRRGLQWAFSKAPADNFAGHAVWSRQKASDPWQLRSGTAVMSQDRPAVPVPAAERPPKVPADAPREERPPPSGKRDGGDARLNPPWLTLYEQVVHSVGADPRFDVRPLQDLGATYRIDVHVRVPAAEDLAMLLKPRHEFGNVTVFVRVFNAAGALVPPAPPAGDDQLLAACRRMFRRNPYYAETIHNPDAPPWQGKVVVVFKRAVIQYYNDDLSDYYGNANEVARDVFGQVLQTEWGDGARRLKLSLTTAKR
jgi:hypothetical protein